MKIEVKSEANTNVNQIHDGYIVSHYDVDNLIGKVLTQIEAVGLPERQEKSLKDILKQTIRAGVDPHQSSFCDGALLNTIHKFNRMLHEECIKNPPKEVDGFSPRDGKYEVRFTSTN